MIQITTTITQHREVAPGYYRLRFTAPSIAAAALAGQFVHVLPRSPKSMDPLLRRAFSILSVQQDSVDILYRVEGRGTWQMARFHEGDTLDVIGPLGQAFTPSSWAILVGGGVGVPPLAMLATQMRQSSVTASDSHASLAQSGRTSTSATYRSPSFPDYTPDAPSSGTPEPVKMQALIGARSHNELICMDIFADCQVPVQVATDDGSAGLHGFVTEWLEQHLASIPSAGTLPVNAGPTVYACGPLGMLRAVAAICTRFQLPCQVSLEENMPCGVGVCNGCVVRAATAGDDYGQYRRICVEGPVMWAHEIAW
jgi:dihydroorotate dehydrogenase electron transfer subunit